jgi:hypothetical protein
MISLFGAACTADPKIVVTMDTASLERSYAMREAVKFYLQAMEAEVLRRAMVGEVMTKFKLVNKKANRVLKDGAEVVFKTRYGDEAMTKPGLKSPSELEKIDAAAKALVKEWAFTPKTGMTIAPIDDPRLAIKVQPLAEVYTGVITNGN